jgi:hypothetical protein
MKRIGILTAGGDAPYHSVNVDVNKVICFLDSRTVFL